MRTSQRGIALILVLWVITLLTVMALGLTASQRTGSALTRNSLDTVRFRVLSEAALNFAALNLLVPPPSLDLDPEADIWLPDGAPHTWVFNGESLKIAVSNEGSKIDLNQADGDLLTRLFLVLGVEDNDAIVLADTILDWRDEDDMHQLNGAEDGDYEQAGLPYGAKDDKFASIEELQQVLGVDRSLYQLLAPLVTVYSKDSNVDTAFAPAAVLAALEDTTLEDAELAIEERALEQQAPAISRGGPRYRVRVIKETDSGSGSGSGMEALIETTPGLQPPFQVLWRRFGLILEATDAQEAAGAENADQQ